ncbi:MAG: type II secretion system F family protein [Candidatus Omnitrophica bacterium]|nr:type II secretion system F family protein [Candidatus Omnitrophota bacterium]
MNINLILAYLLFFVSTFLFSYLVAPWFINKWLNRQSKKVEKVADKLEDIFVFIKGKKLTIILGLLPLGLGLLGAWLFKWIGLGLGIICGLVLPMAVLRMAVARKRVKFVKQLVDGLMILSSCLKGGLSLIQAFEVLVEETTPPLSQEFNLVLREIRLGVSIEEALIRLSKRIPSDELGLFVSAILVARETGGDLTKVFSRLVTTLRDRTEIKEEVVTLTTQAKVQAIILSLLPVGFVWWVYRVDPHHFDVMFQTDLGKILLTGGGVLYFLALFLLKKFSIVRI